jgi:hypothetical protein
VPTASRGAQRVLGPVLVEIRLGQLSDSRHINRCVKTINYVYAYFGTGTVILIAVLSSHLLHREKESPGFKNVMAALHPERKTIKYKILTNVIPNALTAVSFFVAWPIMAIIFLNKQFWKTVKPSSSAASFQEERVEVPRDWLIKKITISEAEAAHPGIRGERLLQFPNAGKPFGFQNDLWESLKAKMKPGDELWTFRSSGESWRNLAGRSGIVLLRDGEAIADIITLMN